MTKWKLALVTFVSILILKETLAQAQKCDSTAIKTYHVSFNSDYFHYSYIMINGKKISWGRPIKIQSNQNLDELKTILKEATIIFTQTDLQGTYKNVAKRFPDLENMKQLLDTNGKTFKHIYFNVTLSHARGVHEFYLTLDTKSTFSRLCKEGSK